MKRQWIFAICLLFCLIAPLNFSAAAKAPGGAFSPSPAIEKYFRTELYFGMNKPDGSQVGEEDWNEFLAQEVTPRFPSGFTVLEGYGQFQDSNNKINREKSRCLILFYPKKERKSTGAKIEEIRAAYKKSFRQESVLRLDFKKSVRVSF